MFTKFTNFIKSILYAPSKFDILKDAMREKHKYDLEHDWREHTCQKCAYSKLNSLQRKSYYPNLLCRNFGGTVEFNDAACPSFIPKYKK